MLYQVKLACISVLPLTFPTMVGIAFLLCGSSCHTAVGVYALLECSSGVVCRREEELVKLGKKILPLVFLFAAAVYGSDYWVGAMAASIFSIQVSIAQSELTKNESSDTIVPKIIIFCGFTLYLIPSMLFWGTVICKIVQREETNQGYAKPGFWESLLF